MLNDDKNIRRLIKTISLKSPSLDFNDALMQKIQVSSKSAYTPLVNKKIFQIFFAIFAVLVVFASFTDTSNSSTYKYEINDIISIIINHLPKIIVPEWLILSTAVIFILLLTDMFIKKIIDSKIR